MLRTLAAGADRGCRAAARRIGAGRTTTTTTSTAEQASATTVPRRSKEPVFQPGRYTVPPPIRVPSHVRRPSYADHPKGVPDPLTGKQFAEVKTPDQISRMRGANRLAAEGLLLACELAQEGVTTDEVDRAVSEYFVKQNAYPVGINYYGFPRGLCASPNEVALHGVPNTRPLEQGDIINFDVTVFRDGAFGDCSAMVRIGEVDVHAQRLVETTRACLDGAVELVGPGVRLNEVGKFCDSFAKAHGFSVVSEFCGHFIGSSLHMRPNVLHVPNDMALELRPGMTFTIEPILVEGSSAELARPPEGEDDGWTMLVKSGAWSAQWEHTVLVTDHGCDILTQA